MQPLARLSALKTRRTRLVAYGVLAVLLALPLVFQAAVATTTGGPSAGEYPGNRWTPAPAENESNDWTARNRTGTLITVQSYGGFGNNNGKAIIVRDGEVVWEYDPPNSRVFDAEMLANGNVMVSVATKLQPDDCPERALEVKASQCVKNRVVEIDYGTKAVVWQYAWYDEFIHYHEVHDADRLPSGNTAVIDMGNNRAFVVNESGTVVWSWSARKHMGPGSDFWAAYGEHLDEPGVETDWTHMNDIDLLENGNFQLSIRNFDVVVEVDPATKEIVDVIGAPQGSGGDGPGTRPVLHHQHNPMRIESGGTVLVADSEANRIVELDVETGEVVWEYDRNLEWPRDADRLPNGNTLITDSLGFRVIEVTPNGTIAWAYQVFRDGKRGIPYEADRISIPEEPDDVPSFGNRSAVDADADGGIVERIGRYATFALLYLPRWMGVTDLLLLAGIVAVGVVGALDLVAAGVRVAADAVRE